MSDNICLIPASQLPFKDEWLRVAQGLPAREALLVIPSTATPLRQVAHALVPYLRAHHRHITTVDPGISADEVRQRQSL